MRSEPKTRNRPPTLMRDVRLWLGRGMICLRTRRHTNAGREIERLRLSLARGEHDERLPKSHVIDDFLCHVDGLRIEDMPPDAYAIAALLETLCQRLGGVGRNEAWASIGVSWQRGRRFARGEVSLDWPIWFTLHDGSVGRGEAWKARR